MYSNNLTHASSYGKILYTQAAKLEKLATNISFCAHISSKENYKYSEQELIKIYAIKMFKWLDTYKNTSQLLEKILNNYNNRGWVKRARFDEIKNYLERSVAKPSDKIAHVLLATANRRASSLNEVLITSLCNELVHYNVIKQSLNIATLWPEILNYAIKYSLENKKMCHLFSSYARANFSRLIVDICKQQGFKKFQGLVMQCLVKYKNNLSLNFLMNLDTGRSDIVKKCLLNSNKIEELVVGVFSKGGSESNSFNTLLLAEILGLYFNSQPSKNTKMYKLLKEAQVSLKIAVIMMQSTITSASKEQTFQKYSI